MIDPRARTAPREERSDTRDEQPGSDLWPRRDLLLLLGITIFGAALRLFRIEQWSLSAAEASTWRAVTTHGDGGSIAGEAGGPVVAVLRWLFDAGMLPTHREDWLRLPFAFAGILAVPLAALAAGRLAARSTALLTAALLAFHPWHVAVSQTATTPGMALFFAMAAVAAAPRAAATAPWLRWLGPACCLALAVACDPCAWLAVLAGVVLVSGRSWPKAPRTARWLIATLCTLLLAGSVWWAASWPSVDAESGAAWLGALLLRVRLPVGLCALAGLLFIQSWPLAVAVGVPGCVLGAVALAGKPVHIDALVLVLPALLLLAASAGERCFALARGSRGAPLGASVTGALVWLGIVGSLATDSFLYGVEEQGQRAPWRAAALQALGGTGESSGLLVGAGVGANILTCYLRPGHWSERGRDPHPGRAVEQLDRERLSAAVGEFGARTATGRVMLVLRHDEMGRLSRAEASDPLRSFELVSVLPCPLEGRDETLYVFRRVAE